MKLNYIFLWTSFIFTITYSAQRQAPQPTTSNAIEKIRALENELPEQPGAKQTKTALGMARLVAQNPQSKISEVIKQLEIARDYAIEGMHKNQSIATRTRGATTLGKFAQDAIQGLINELQNKPKEPVQPPVKPPVPQESAAEKQRQAIAQAQEKARQQKLEAERQQRAAQEEARQKAARDQAAHVEQERLAQQEQLKKDEEFARKLAGQEAQAKKEQEIQKQLAQEARLKREQEVVAKRQQEIAQQEQERLKAAQLERQKQLAQEALVQQQKTVPPSTPIENARRELLYLIETLEESNLPNAKPIIILLNDALRKTLKQSPNIDEIILSLENTEKLASTQFKNESLPITIHGTSIHTIGDLAILITLLKEKLQAAKAQAILNPIPPTPAPKPAPSPQPAPTPKPPSPQPVGEGAPRGIRNLGVSCFMNGVLQSLFSLDQFTDEVLQNANHYKSDSLAQHYIQLAHALKGGGTADPTPFCMAGWKSMGLKANTQQDALEFLETLLDHLLEKDITQQNTHLNNLINFKIESYTQEKPLITHFLHIPPNCSMLTDCIKNFFITERAGTIQKKFGITQLGRYFIVGLERNDPNTMKKDTKAVSFPFDLDLQSYMAPGKKAHHYRLKAFVVHSGQAGGGHYWAYVRKGNTWYRADDSSVTPISQADIAKIAGQGYVNDTNVVPVLFFYEAT